MAGGTAGTKTKRRYAALLFAAAAVVAALAALLVDRGHGGEPIRIGVLHSLSGSMAASEVPLVDAARLAVEEINARGGLLGRPVEMIVADGRSDWSTFASEAERLIAEEKVSALFGCWTSACRKAVKPVVERHDHLLFYPLQHEGMERSPNIVYTGSAPNQQIIPGARWALEHFGKRVYLVGSDYVFPRAANRIIRDLATATDATILGERYLGLAEGPDARLIAELRRLQPDLVINSLNGESNLHFFRALHEARLGALPVLSFSISEVELAAIGKDAFHPAHYAAWSYFQSLPHEDNRRFVTAFKARFGADRVTSDPIEAAYVGVLLWAQAVREAGTEETGFVNRSIGRQSIPGPSGVMAVDGATRHLWKPFRIGRAREDGQFTQIAASEENIRPTPFPTYRSVADWLSILREQEARSEHQP